MELYSSSSSSTASSDKYNLLGRKVMQISLLLAVVGYSFFLFNEDEYSYDFTEASRRLATGGDNNGKQRRRQLATSSARNGLHPPDTDIANDLFIIKPVVGYATLDSLEDTLGTLFHKFVHFLKDVLWMMEQKSKTPDERGSSRAPLIHREILVKTTIGIVVGLLSMKYPTSKCSYVYQV